MILRQLIPLVLLVLLFSCNSNKVTNTEDYKTYMSATIDDADLLESVNLWTKKLEAHPNQFPYYGKRASAYSQLFSATGEISYLKKAEADLLKAIEMSGSISSGYLKSLASNYISQHRFKDALDLLKKAEANGDQLNGTYKMLFDVQLELGNYIYAESYLNDIKNPSDFDYLIRLAKWKDHNGDLDGAIVEMEKATAIAESSNLKGMKQWAYTNLADFYGHSGQIESSYNYFLKALTLDPNDAYAKKGIAWIVYSHENNAEEALRILDHVTSYYKAPDYDLLKAEIADFKNDTALKTKALTDYQDAVRNELYGDMYNAYNVIVYNDDLILPEHALEIAKREVENRPTPQSYDLLAWSYFRAGEIKKANAITEQYVEGHTFEPVVLYHTAEIYKAMGKQNKVEALKDELVASLYELGPTMITKINQL